MSSSREDSVLHAQAEPFFVIKYNSQFRYFTGMQSCTSESIAVANLFLRMSNAEFYYLLNNSTILIDYLNSSVETGITLNQKISDGYLFTFFDSKKKHILEKKSAEDVFDAITDKNIQLAGIEQLLFINNETLVTNELSDIGLKTLANFLASYDISRASNEAFILTGNGHSTALLLKENPENGQLIYVIFDSGATIVNGEMRVYLDLDDAYQCLLEKWNGVLAIEVNTIQYPHLINDEMSLNQQSSMRY